MKISDAEVADLLEILELQKLAYQSEAILYNDWSLPAITQTIPMTEFGQEPIQ